MPGAQIRSPGDYFQEDFGQLYCSSDESLWLADMGLSRPDIEGDKPAGPDRFYFAANDGNEFHQLMDAGSVKKGGGTHTRLDGLGNLGPLCLETQGLSARLLDAAGETEITHLHYVGPMESDRILRAAQYYLLHYGALNDRVHQGDASALLAWWSTMIDSQQRRFNLFYFTLEDPVMEPLMQQALTDERSLWAWAILGKYFFKAKEHVSRERIVEAAYYFHGNALENLFWLAANRGDHSTVPLIAGLALTSREAFNKLLLLACRWNNAEAVRVLKRMPLDKWVLNAYDLHKLIEFGHLEAKQKLLSKDVSSVIAKARSNGWAENILNCSEVGELQIYARYGHQQAIKGLIELFADGHIPAREAVQNLQKENVHGFDAKTLSQSIHLEKLAAKAALSPRTVYALAVFYKEFGLVGADAILKNLEVEWMINAANTNVEAVRALMLLDQYGNESVIQNINKVIIKKWKEEYDLGGQSKFEGREAREAMSLLANLGNEAACEYESMAVPQRVVAALMAIQLVQQLQAEGVSVDAFASAPQTPDLSSLAPSLSVRGSSKGIGTPS